MFEGGDHLCPMIAIFASAKSVCTRWLVQKLSLTSSPETPRYCSNWPKSVLQKVSSRSVEVRDVLTPIG